VSKWWKSSRDKRAAQLRGTRNRLRASYKQQVQQDVERLTAAALKAADDKVRLHKAEAEERVRMAEEKLARIGREVARLTLEFGPSQWRGTRFTMYCRFDERFIVESRELREIGPMIVERLAKEVAHQLRVIDFARIQPKYHPQDEGRPTWTIDGVVLPDPSEAPTRRLL